MSFSFGSNTTTQSTAFGSAAKPSFSFGGTNTATTSTAGFGGFGTSTTSSGFGTFGAPTSTATPFGGLGATPASTAPSLFGGAGFGTTAAKPGFGTSTFGTNTFGTGSTFGTGTSTFGSAAPSFGTNTLGSNTFGGSTFGTGSTFGSTFGAKPATTGFSGFGTGLGASTAFGQQQQQLQQQQQGPTTAHEALVAAVFNCSVFGDERDQVLAKWNLLQAQWGTGQAYYSRNAPALELNEQNPLCRFKAVGYSRLGGREDKDGHVAMLFNKPEQDIKNNQQALTNSLSNLLGNKPNLVVNIDAVKAVSESKTQVVVYVVDKNASGCRVGASELGAFLGAGAARAALTGAGCSAIAPATTPSPAVRAHHLQAPPPGMDMRLWKQAQADNPDPENYIPVPIVGFSEIKFRARCQSEEAKLQASWLRRTADTLAELRTRRAASGARLAHMTARLHALRHTLLQVISRQEVTGRVGAALAPEEEAARARFHELASQLSAPPLYNGRLNELLCAVRLQRSASGGAAYERYSLDPGAQEDVKQFLTLQQRGMAHLLDTAQKDLDALNTIADGMSRLVRA
ncbi:LOW QUALITY PROTEIN: probable nucleoporin Nup54 [Achroia grisella]|uniref:LOW QUALITY PROTEIN: probable nucleoporin Nup54 n=1 Tax=Achroia grisella TaxID=688607 RepID=UPI0027D26BD8|nr:LOW QUALITY PROTEIN: probable nucleoporin Nup54 [Achroia grisella]